MSPGMNGIDDKLWWWIIFGPKCTFNYLHTDYPGQYIKVCAVPVSFADRQDQHSWYLSVGTIALFQK